MARLRLVTPAGLASLLMVGLLVFLLVQLVRLGLSDVVALGARYDVERWAVAGSAKGSLAQDAIQADLAKALALAPDDPQLLEDLGRFYDLQGLRFGSDVAGARAARQQSLTYFRQAAAARPTSSMAALSLALLKLKLGEVDPEFSFFLGRAFENGPWEPRIQLMAIRLGLSAWAVLPERQRQQVRVAVNNQLSWTQVNQRPAILNLLKEFGRDDLHQESQPQL